MAKEEFLHLQHSEAVVAQMAATLLAAHIQNQTLNAGNEDALVEQAVSLAIKLANQTEKLVKSDEEWVKKESGGSPYLLG